MKAFASDFVTTHETLHGHELSNVASGETAYKLMLSNTVSSIIDYMNERFHAILKDPVLKASCIFEHVRWPSITSNKLALEAYGEEEVSLLLDHYATLFAYLGGDATKALQEWRRLKLFISRSDNLLALSYMELYHSTSACSTRRETSSFARTMVRRQTRSMTSPSTTSSCLSPSS